MIVKIIVFIVYEKEATGTFIWADGSRKGFGVEVTESEVDMSFFHYFAVTRLDSFLDNKAFMMDTMRQWPKPRETIREENVFKLSCCWNMGTANKKEKKEKFHSNMAIWDYLHFHHRMWKTVTLMFSWNSSLSLKNILPTSTFPEMNAQTYANNCDDHPTKVLILFKQRHDNKLFLPTGFLTCLQHEDIT